MQVRAPCIDTARVTSCPWPKQLFLQDAISLTATFNSDWDLSQCAPRNVIPHYTPAFLLRDVLTLCSAYLMLRLALVWPFSVHVVHGPACRYPFDTQTLRGTFSLVSNVANAGAAQWIRINLTEAAAMQSAAHLKHIFPASTWQVCPSTTIARSLLVACPHAVASHMRQTALQLPASPCMPLVLRAGHTCTLAIDVCVPYRCDARVH